MIETALNLLNGNSIINDKLPAIIEVFVEFYGEENRPHIEELFNNMEIICFNKPSEKEYILNHTIDEIKDKYYEIFYNKYHIGKDDKHRNEYLPNTMLSKGYSLLDKYQEYLSKKNMSQEEKYQETVSSFMDLLNNRYGYKGTFKDILAMKGTPAIDKFLSKVPQFLRPYIESCIADEYVDIDEQQKKKQLVDKLSSIYPEVTMSNFDELYANRANNVLCNLDSMLEDFCNMKHSFLEEVKPLLPYLEYCQKCKALETEIDEKTLANIILSFQDLMPQEEIEELKKRLSSNKKMSFYGLPTIESYFSTSLSYISPMSCFSSESESILRGDPENWRVDSIKHDRIRYFNKKGINKGTNYDDYANDLNCQALIPETDVVDKILQAREKGKEQSTMEYYRSLPDYKEIRERIISRNPVSDDYGWDENTYENTLMCVCPNITKDENGTHLLPLGIFRLDLSKLDAIDAYIMHELNHIYELKLIKENEDSIEYQSGWDSIVQPKHIKDEVTLKKDESKRDYELFNEIINELISQDLTRLMHDNGIYLFSKKDNARISNKTSYESTMFIIRDFYKLYYDDIIASRRSKSLDKLIAKVGEDNFNELNGLFNVFNEHFSGMKVYTLYKQLNQKEDTKLTRIYNSILEKRDLIMARMLEHSKEYDLNEAPKMS